MGSDLSKERHKLLECLEEAAVESLWWQKHTERTWVNRLRKLTRFRGRYLLYQLSKIRPINITTDTFWGAKMKCYLPDYFFLLLYGILADVSEVRLSKFVIRNLKSDEVFFDIGASCGFYTLLANHILDSGEVHSFEPAPRIFEMLEWNTNDLKNISINKLAVSDSSGVFDFYLDPIFPVTSSLVKPMANHPRKVLVDTVTIDDYIGQNSVVPTLVKIDVEGAEDRVISGAEDTFKSLAPTVAMEIFREGNDAHLQAVERLFRIGYGAYLINASGGLESVSISKKNIRELIPDGKKFENFIFKKASV